MKSKQKLKAKTVSSTKDRLFQSKFNLRWNKMYLVLVYKVLISKNRVVYKDVDGSMSAEPSFA